MNILKKALVAATAFAGLALVTAPASALPVVPHGIQIETGVTQEARLVCNRFGRCVRVRGYGYGYGRPYRRGPYYRGPGFYR